MQCILGLYNLIEMCTEDPMIMRYVFEQPPVQLQHARYIDWIFPYVEDQLVVVSK